MLRKPHKLRVFILAGTVALLSATVIGRLYYLQVVEHEKYDTKANSQHSTRVVLQPQRGDIVDRKNQPLATSTGALSVYINPKFFKEPEAEPDLNLMAEQIAYHADMEKETVRQKLIASQVTLIGRQLEPEIAEKLIGVFKEHDISSRGYWYDRETKRHYLQDIGAHIVGFTGKNTYGDNRGLAGIELQYADELDGALIESQTAKTNLAQIMQPIPQDDLMAARGHTIRLTLDAAIQSAAEEALQEAAEEFQPKGMGVVVMDVYTGEILALASWPTYNNNNAGKFPEDFRRNRILTDPIETGSVVKLFTAAILLDQNLVEVDTMIDCGNGSAYFGSRRVRDAPGHYMGVVPFYEVIRNSSNVGIIRAAERLDNETWYQYLRGFGLGEKSGIDLPGEDNGILYPTSKWTSYSRSSLPMGYEMALTPIQIVSGIAALVNGGTLMRPYVVAEMTDSRGNLVWEQQPLAKRQVIHPMTSQLMKQLMEDVVLNGSGKGTQIPGFRVGGKTGTTRKSHINTHREYISSFGGALPIDDPAVAIYTFVDDPQGKYYGSSVAVPIFHAVAQECILQLGLVPSWGYEGRVIEEENPIQEQPLLRFTTDITASSTTIPDLRGLTMLEARQYLANRFKNVSFRGSGIVIDQYPTAGTAVDSETEIILLFRNADKIASERTSGDG